jgi:adenylate kinase
MMDSQIEPQMEIKADEPPPFVEPVYVPYEESDFRSRVPAPAYERMKELEDRVLALSRENLKVVVVCSGLWYGRGENVF